MNAAVKKDSSLSDKVKNTIVAFTHIGFTNELTNYEVKRLLIFNYCNLLGLLASLSRLIYIALLSHNKYTHLTIIANVLPLLLCVIMLLCLNSHKYKSATYVSFLCFPPVLFLMYSTTLDRCAIFFQILYLIFPFFFLHKKLNIIAAFLLSATCFLMSELAGELHLLYYKSDFYLFDGPLLYIDSFFSIGFIFAALYAIKFQVWSYEKSITRKRLELKQLNSFKDKMFSLISHDFRSPFAATAQLISLLKETPVSQEEFNVYITDLENQTNAAIELIDNMFAWSRNHLDNQQVICRQVNLNEIIYPTFRLLNKQAATKEIQLINEVNNDSSAFIDKDMITIVIRNLLTNAIKFTNPGGYVKIREGQATQNSIALVIEDNGIGIPPEKQAIILENEYYTTNGTAKETGTGLGLKICQDFIEKNNGTIRVESVLGVGTSFFITMPIASSF